MGEYGNTGWPDLIGAQGAGRFGRVGTRPVTPPQRRRRRPTAGVSLLAAVLVHAAGAVAVPRVIADRPTIDA
ncbi:MAG: hypothetical protein RLZZ362_189, partial [Actinomycetota bacterium]